MNKFFKNSIFIWISLTLIITFIAYSGGKSGGTVDAPVFLSKEVRENPSLLFWNMLPSGAFVSAIITIVGAFIVYKINKSY